MTYHQAQQQPQGQSHGGDDLVDAVAGFLAVAVVILITAPIIAVALITHAALRGRDAAVRGKATLTGGLLAGIFALWPGWRRAWLEYKRPYAALSNHLFHHLPLHLTAGTVLGVSFVALPAGLVAGCALDPLLSRRRRKGQAKQGGGAPQPKAPRATKRDLPGLVIKAPTGDRITLGTLDGKLVVARPESHVAIIAPTRSGKTRGLILPSLLEWSGPVIATSSKGDLLWDEQYSSGAYAYRNSMGEVWIFDPSESSGWGCVHWSPLGRAESWQGALRAAYAMVAASQEGTNLDSTAQFFQQRAMAALAPSLHAIAIAGGGMGDVYELVVGSGSLDALADELEEGLAGASPEAIRSLAALRAGSATSSGDTMATLSNILSPYSDPTVSKNTSRSEWEPMELLFGCNTLFIISGPGSSRLAPLFACLIDEIFDTVAEEALKSGRPLSPRLLMALDEVANIAPLATLPQRLATVSGQGVSIITSWQSAGQMQRFGGTQAKSEILSNSGAQLWVASDDPEASEHLSRLLGRTYVQTQSVSSDIQQGWFGPPAQDRSISTSWVERSVLDPSVSRLLSGPLLVAQGCKPTELEWRFHDEDRLLSRRSSMRPIRSPVEKEVDPDNWLSAYVG
jgi:type IV secretion system protein VirD4